MRKEIAMWILLVFIAVSLSHLMGQSRFGMSPGSTLASCALSAPKELAFCNVAGDPLNGDGLYVSANGAGYFLVGKGVQSGVQTYNGRTGNVTSAQGDYSFAQLSGALSATQIPTHTCTMTTAAGTNAAVITLSGCK